MSTIDGQSLADRADEFVSRLDRTERVAWLKIQGFTDVQILDALLSAEDPKLDDLVRQTASAVAIAVADGELTPAPRWLS